jgi:DNA-binding transcriptional LysR family regulator
MDVNPAHVRTLQTIVQTGSFVRAAETLHLSQPALSHHIRHLETALGVPVLERLGRRATATAAGRLLLEHAGRAFRELERAREAIQQRQGLVAGRVSIGTGATASIHLLPPVLGELYRRYPALDLVVVTGNAPDVASAVERDELDVGIVTLPVSGRALAVSPFYLDRLVAIAPPGREWRRRLALTPAELARHPLILYERGGTIRRIMDEWFRRGRALPRVAMELGDTEATKKLVGAGLGVSIVSEVAVQMEARAGALDVIGLSPPLHRTLGIVRRRDKPVRPALQALLAALARRRRAPSRRIVRAR